jgi:branched-chain amino acid transport system ATP-binding protein
VTVLEVEGLVRHFGGVRAVDGVGFTLAAGELLALIGPNGAGKSTCFNLLMGQLRPDAGRNGAGTSTTLKSIMGLVRISAGTVRFAGQELRGLPPYRIARAGIGYVPEERRVFAELTVLENLEVGRQPPRAGAPLWTVDALFALFPNLAEARDRPASHMSGGEQQMLVIARTLMGKPRLLLLDEPSESLAPVVVGQIAAAVQRLKREGVAVLLSEQNLRFAAAVADRTHVIEKGQIRFAGPMAALEHDHVIRSAYLGL